MSALKNGFRTETTELSLDMTATQRDKRALKLDFLERENRDLQQALADVQTTLAINKEIISGLLAGDSAAALQARESAGLAAALQRVSEERDQALARLFISQQIMENAKDKEADVAELFRDEIEELKENLERKEYLLQVNEQRYSEFEKLLAQVAQYDENVRSRLEDINAVPRDRKISNVVLENGALKAAMEELRYENERLRDQLEQAQG